jgi:hypothetical protein
MFLAVMFSVNVNSGDTVDINVNIVDCDVACSRPAWPLLDERQVLFGKNLDLMIVGICYVNIIIIDC